MKTEINGDDYYFDGYLIKNLEIIREAVQKKWDGLFYIGGYEGDGKSEFAAQLAFYLDPTYNIDRCVFTPEQFIEAVNKAKPKTAIVYDEAQDVMESTARDKSAREIKSMLTRIRKKQLYIFIVAPDFWRINKYLFIHRARAFIRVYSNGLERGFFEYYNREKKHELKIRGQRYEQLCVPPNFRGRYTHWFPLDEEAYDSKKEEATQNIGEEKLTKHELLITRIIRAEWMHESQKMQLLDIKRRQLLNLIKKYGIN